MTEESIADFTFIGGGIACTISLTELLDQLITLKPHKVYNIVVVEQYPELWKGIPYGKRSSVNALTINTVNDFFTNEVQGKMFFNWFVENEQTLLRDYLTEGGTAAGNWLLENKKALDEQQWDNVYFPRYIIGIYFEQKFKKSLHTALQLGLIKLSIVNREAIKIASHINGFEIILINSHPGIKTKKVIVAIGSAPEKYIFDDLGVQQDILVIDKLYHPSMVDNIAKIRSLVLRIPKINILLVGSNASAIELLYLIANDNQINDSLGSITVLSKSGKLPAHITYTSNEGNVCNNLEKLEGTAYTIETLISAATKDIMLMPDNEVSVPNIDSVVNYVLKLLKPLDEHAKKMFYAVYGVQLARLFRRSGTDYKRATDNLLSVQKLTLLKGKFIALKAVENSATLSYAKEKDDTPIVYKKQFNVVINCTGADDLEQSESRLIQNLLLKNNCKVNPSKKAFEVDDKLQAAPGIYITGPLAGGNYNSLLSFWHLENASRIMYLAPYLAKQLLAD